MIDTSTQIMAKISSATVCIVIWLFCFSDQRQPTVVGLSTVKLLYWTPGGYAQKNIGASNSQFFLARPHGLVIAPTPPPQPRSTKKWFRFWARGGCIFQEKTSIFGEKINWASCMHTVPSFMGIMHHSWASCIIHVHHASFMGIIHGHHSWASFMGIIHGHHSWATFIAIMHHS